MEKWLITGGCGFIGTNLIRQLKGKAHIRVLDNLSVGTREDLGLVCDFVEGRDAPFDERVQLVEGSILDETLVEEVTKGIDVVVHLAANTGVLPSLENPKLDMEMNVIGTVNVLEGCRKNGVGHFIFASSGAPLGDQEPPFTELKVARPVSPYGASKLAGEAYCSAYAHSFDIKTVALRFSNVYGPLSTHKGSVVAKFIKQAMDGETLIIYGDGEQTRDFIYIDDLVEAIILASKARRGGEVFNISTGNETSVNHVTGLLKDALALHDIKLKVDYRPARKGEVLRNFSDSSKARRVLGWEPKEKLAVGLAKTAAYFAAKQEISNKE